MLRYFILASWLLVLPWQVQAELAKPEKIKAAYLYNFTKYIRWPETEFATPETPVKLCSNAEPEFMAFLAALVEGRTAANGRNIQVLEAGGPEPVPCHLLFLKPKGSFPDQAKSGLVVGDTAYPGPTATNARFFIENRKLRFEFDLADIQRRGLNVSSELLKLARVVRQKGDGP